MACAHLRWTPGWDGTQLWELWKVSPENWGPPRVDRGHVSQQQPPEDPGLSVALLQMDKVKASVCAGGLGGPLG